MRTTAPSATAREIAVAATPIVARSLDRGLLVNRPGQVCCTDITSIPMRRGFLCLMAIMDWHSRKMLA